MTAQDAVEVNDRVTLTCSAPSVPPATFTWRFNGSVTDVRTATFVIDKSSYKNTGMYTCEVHNAVTGRTGQSAHFLSVKGEPQPGVAAARRRPRCPCLMAALLAEEGSLDEGLSDGAIAGIVIAVLVVVGTAIGLFLYCRQKVP